MRGRWPAVAAVLGAVLMLAGIAGGAGTPIAQAEDLTLIVTNRGDAVEAVCPDPLNCTLRRAIEAANADESGATLKIAFDPAVFPVESPATITLTVGPLPALTANFAEILGTGAGVTLDGQDNAEIGSGLVVEGAGNAVRGMRVVGFPAGACIRATGPGAAIGGDEAADGNIVGGCATGILAEGATAVVANNLAGFSPNGDEADSVDTGIEVRNGGASIAENIVGHAIDGIVIGAGASTDVNHNTLGASSDGGPAGVARGVVIEASAIDTTVRQNTFAHAGRAIVVEPDVDGFSSVGNKLGLNSFASLDGLAIDLGDDSIRNVSDPGDEDMGPNGMLNSPAFSNVTQSAISGTACAGCLIDLYFVAHAPGGAGDHPTTRIPAGTTIANGSGTFSFPSPPLTPGQWISAIATHPEEGTSEFSQPLRVGAGIIQCGNVNLAAGWTHAGYFGSAPLSLNSSFPPQDPGAVDIIYEFVESAGTFAQWIAGTPGATLRALDPGNAYWYHATSGTTVPGGLSLTVPVPVALKAGWNDFVYLGASETTLDALSSIAGQYTVVHEFVAGADGGHWRTYAGNAVPGWVNTLTEIAACGAYQVQMAGPATLEPLQP